MSETGAIVAVLAGGQATRMGGAKATLALRGRPLISYPLAAAREAGLQAVVVAKHATALPALAEPVIVEPEHPIHPLCGVLAALDFAAARPDEPAVLVAACDMPFLTGPLLAWLAGLQGPVMATLEGLPQPMLARVEPAHRARLQSALDSQAALGAALSSLSPRLVAERELGRFGEPARLLFNVNRPQDLRTAEGWLG